MATQQSSIATFQVLDAMDAPHGGRILRLRLVGGEPPALRSLKGSRVKAVSPTGDERFARVEGFPLFGGKATDRRLARSGRLDLHVVEEAEGLPIACRWQVSGPVS
jgi:hypothetical protein